LPDSANTADRFWLGSACRGHPPTLTCWDKPPWTLFGSLYPSSRRVPIPISARLHAGRTSCIRGRFPSVPNRSVLWSDHGQLSSSMTRAAARNVLHCANVILALQRHPQFCLIGVFRPIRERYGMARCRLLVVHVEDLVPWTKELLRCSVALQTPLH